MNLIVFIKNFAFLKDKINLYFLFDRLYVEHSLVDASASVSFNVLENKKESSHTEEWIVSVNDKVMSFEVPLSAGISKANKIEVVVKDGCSERFFKIPIFCKDTKSFKKYLSMVDGRPRDYRNLACLAYRSSLCESLKDQYRISSSVIYIYKAIEFPEVSSKLSLTYIYDYVDLAYANLKNKGGVREDGVQVYLSVLTAAWHYAVQENDVDLVINFLDKIHDVASMICDKENSDVDNKSTYSKNIGISLLLKAYIHARLKETSKSNAACDLLMKYNIINQSELQGKGFEYMSNMDPSVFNDTLSCGRATMLGLCVKYENNGKRKKSVTEKLKEKNIIKCVSRIKRSSFNNKFFDFLSSI